MARLAIESSTSTRIVLAGRELLYFGGCGYLGLAHHPRVLAALAQGAARLGVSAGASRETTGNCVLYDQLERELALRFHCPSALLTPEGYTANFVAAQVLAREHTLALIDERSHASVFDAARAAGLRIEFWPHHDLAALERLTREHGRQAVVACDGVQPSRGEIAPLRAMAELCGASEAALWVDDCHGVGVVGPSGRGSLEHEGVSGERVLLTATLSKALGCYGGFVAGPQRWIDAAREHSAAYIGSTPPPPPIAAAALVALELAFDDGTRLATLRSNCALLRTGFHALGLPTPRAELPVFAFALPHPEAMGALHEHLLAQGVFAPHVRYLGSPSGGNFRIVVNAEHTGAEIERLIHGLASGLGRELA